MTQPFKLTRADRHGWALVASCEFRKWAVRCKDTCYIMHTICWKVWINRSLWIWNHLKFHNDYAYFRYGFKKWFEHIMYIQSHSTYIQLAQQIYVFYVYIYILQFAKRSPNYLRQKLHALHPSETRLFVEQTSLCAAVKARSQWTPMTSQEAAIH